MASSPNPPIIVLGAPRSGTSLIAGVLHSRGIAMGSDLLEPDSGNPHGYFEDIDFIDFHRQLLARTAASVGRVFEDSTMREQAFDFEPTLADITTAKALIEQRSELSSWGWKDPRTCLFLPFWRKLLPDARFIIAYKHPLEMSASLLRMGKNWDLALDPLIAVRSWTFYMSETLKLIREIPQEQCFIANTGSLINDPATLIKRLKEWGINQIDSSAFTSHIVPKLTTESKPSPNTRRDFAHHFPEAAQVFEQLQHVSAQPMEWLPQPQNDDSQFSSLLEESLDPATALTVLQSRIQPIAAKKNNSARSELRRKVSKVIRYRFAHETTLENKLHALEKAHLDETKQLEVQQATIIKELNNNLHALEKAHLYETKQLEVQQATIIKELSDKLHALEKAHLYETKQLEVQQATITKELETRITLAQRFRDIVEHMPKNPTRYDDFGRPLSPPKSQHSRIQQWQLKRATLTNWALVQKKTQASQIWIIDLCSLLPKSTEQNEKPLKQHWEQVAKDISADGFAGEVQPNTCQNIFTAIQSEHFNNTPQAPVISLDSAYHGLAEKFNVPITVAGNWSQHRALTLGQTLQPSAAFKDWLHSLSEQGNQWICSGFHGFSRNALITFVEALKLPLTPFEYVCSESLPHAATALHHFDHWLNALNRKNWNDVAWLGTSSERDYYWPKQFGIHNCYLLDTPTKNQPHSLSAEVD